MFSQVGFNFFQVAEGGGFMRGAIGPFVTTGVALVVAAVVVANPIAPPPAAVQIPAVQMSGATDNSRDLLDPTFLEKFAAAAPPSTDPIAVLEQLLASLVGNASRISEDAIAKALAAGAAGAAAAAPPTLTDSAVPRVSMAVTEAPVTPTLPIS